VKVVEIKPLPLKDKKQIGKMIEELNRLYAADEITELAFFYYDLEGIVRVHMSDSLRMSSLAVGIEYLRVYLQHWMGM
jgi:hypothetical protein